MNNRGQNQVAGFVVLFMGIIVAITLLNPIFNTQSQLTTKSDVVNESINVASAYVSDNEVNASINYTIYSQSEWKQQSCELESVALRNGAGTSLTADTDYTLYADAGVYSLINTTKTVPATSLNLTYVDFTHCPDGYNTSQGARGIAGIIGLFAALALLAFVLEKSGVTNLTGRFN